MYKKALLSFLTLVGFLWSGCGSPASTTPAATAMPTPMPLDVEPGKMVVGYYPQWVADRGYRVADIPAAQITHINYAFANVSEEGECVLGDPAADTGRSYTADESVSGEADSTEPDALHGNFNQLLQLKEKYPHLKVLISVGGWTWSENFSDAALSEASRQKFGKSCIDLYLKQYKGVFDGIDVDWEYPVSGGLVAGHPEDKHNFTLLMAELREQLDALGSADGTYYLLTIAAAGGGNIEQRYERSEYIQYLDWVNLMTYDLHGTWETTTNFNAPLYQPASDPGDSSLNVDAVVQDYLASGIPAEKLVLGMPFYGHGWKDVGPTDNGLYQPASGPAKGRYDLGSFTYKELKEEYFADYERHWNVEAQVPWLYSLERAIFISYEDPESIAAKAGYAGDQNLAGVMIWELSQGDADMMDAIGQGFQTGGLEHIVPTKDPNAVIVPRPFEAEVHAVSGITIDGSLDDWPTEPAFTLNDKSQLAYNFASKTWGGIQDLSGEIWAGWAEEGLYFAVKVVDDTLLQRVADANLWHGDYVEWQFDTQLEKDYERGTMNSDDYQIGITVGDFDKVQPVAYAWANGPDAPGPIAIEQAQVKTTDGYVLEIFIPIDLLSGIALADGATFGMNVSISDADNIGLGQEAMLSTSATRTYADPTTFGQITLVK